MLRRVETRWISVLGPFKRVLTDFKALLRLFDEEGDASFNLSLCTYFICLGG